MSAKSPFPIPGSTKLSAIAKSAQIIPTRLTFVDIAGLVRGASKGEGLGNQFLANIREVDAIAHVVRCFEDSDINPCRGQDRTRRRHRDHRDELNAADSKPRKARRHLPSQGTTGSEEQLAGERAACCREGRPARFVERKLEEERAFGMLEACHELGLDGLDVGDGWILPSTWVMSESSKQRTTCAIASTSRMLARNWLPRPSPLDAPRTRPAMSTNVSRVGMICADFAIAESLSSRGSGTATSPTFGSMVPERIIRRLRRCRFGQRIEQGRLADIGQPDDTAFEIPSRPQYLSLVMAGLVPAIHVYCCTSKKDVDARVKPGHDNGEVSPASLRCLPSRKTLFPAAPGAPCSGTSSHARS